MTDAFVVDAVRTPMGRYGGVLAGVRPDDMAAHTIDDLFGLIAQMAAWTAVDFDPDAVLRH